MRFHVIQLPKKLSLIVGFLYLSLLSAFPQTMITGVVKSKQNEPVSSATVTVQALHAKNVSGFAATDEGGKFKVIYKGTSDSILITVRGMTIAKVTRKIPNQSANLDFVVEEKENKLKELYVKATPVNRRGDTLSYVVGAFAGQSDRSIEDVLKKLPGIEISSSGGISYNGKAISKFYIEDLDMLDGRYNLATRNIEAKDVASVQVYENHQPIKAESIFSDQAAINLKLKNGSKGIWTVSALVGGGYKPTLWNTELTAMKFARNRQNISLYKGNNTGHTAEEELLKHYDKGALELMGQQGMLAVTQPGTPDVSKKRYLDNQTHSVSVNQLVKTKNVQLTTNLNYYHESLDKEGYSTLVQYLPNEDSPMTLFETVNNSSKENKLDMTFGIQTNKAMEYLRNSLHLESFWGQTKTELISSGNRLNGNNRISQHLKQPIFSISDDLNLMKRIGKNLFRIRLDVDYSNLPHRLSIAPAYYFSSDSLKLLNQEVVQKHFFVKLQTSYALQLGKFNLNFSPKVSMNLRNLTSELAMTDHDGQRLFVPDSMRNSLWYNNYQIGVDQDYTYSSRNRLRIRLSIPAYLSIITNDDQLLGQLVTHKRGIVNPAFLFNYHFSPSMKVFMNGDARKSYGNMNDAYKGYILQSYRNLVRNSQERLFENSSYGGNFGLEYRDALHMWFSNLVGGVRHSRKNILYGYEYDGIMGLKTMQNQPTQAKMYSLAMSSSKSFSFWQTKLEASFGLNKGINDLLLQGEKEKFHSKSLNVGCLLNSTPCKFFNFVYQMSWLKSSQWIDSNTNERFTLMTHSHNGKIWIFPSEKISINFNVDYQYYSEKSSPNTVFADALIRYKAKSMEWELECNNLLNAKRYVSSSISSMSTYFSCYELRPLSLLLKVRFRII